MANLSTIYYNDYSGGLNNTSSDREIARNEASLLHDWDITYQGQLKKRTGLTKKGNTIGSSPIVGLHGYLRSNAAKDLLAVSGTTLYYLNSSTWTALDSGFTTSLDTCMVTCPLNDKVYITNGTETPHVWDRVSTTLNSSLTDLTTLPKAEIMVWHKNFMFFLNNLTVSSTVHPHRLTWSALGAPETVDPGTDYADLPGGGRLITAGDLGNSLVLFKEHSIMFLSGWGDADWTITSSTSNVANIDESVGIAGKWAWTRVGNEIWFMDDEAQVRRIYQTDFDAFRKDIVSTKIQSTLAGINKAQISKVRMWTHADKVFVAVPNGSSTTNNLVLVYDLIASRRTRQEAWTTYTGWNVGPFISYPTNASIDLYFGSSTTGKVYQLTGSDDDSVAIDSRWDGKLDNLNRPEKYKRLKFGYITGEATDDIDVPIYASVDGGSAGKVGTLNLMASGSRLGPTGSFNLGPTGTATLGGNSEAEEKFYFSEGGGSSRAKAVKMSIRHAVAAESPTVNSFSIHYKERQLR